MKPPVQTCASAVLLLALFLLTAGCGRDKPSHKPYKVDRIRRLKRRKLEKKIETEASDPIDQAWNEPPTEGMCRLRLALFGQGRQLKGRPSFMAPQFELVAVEHIERIDGEGTRATDRKKIKRFNPNGQGHFVWELPPGLWQIRVRPLGELWLPWVSNTLELRKDTARSIDAHLEPRKKRRPTD